MHEAVEIKPGIHWVGVEDPELRVFDDLFPTRYGTTYNAYLIEGSEKIALIDTVKAKRKDEFLAKVRQLVDPAEIDYLIVNHTEPDHSGSLEFMLQQCPNATVVCTQAARTFLGNLIHAPFAAHVVKDGEVLHLGDRHLKFIGAPFLHWPDTMFTLSVEDGTLFTCDAFGSHYCGPSIFADKLPDFTTETEFYFDCIMRPFKDKVLAAIAKIAGERIEVLCPSHGPINRHDPWRQVRYYELWSRQESVGNRVVVFYLSPHGNTEKMAGAVAGGAGIPGIEVSIHHINTLDPAKIRDLMESADGLIFGIPTINRDIPKPMWEVLAYLSTVRLKASVAGVFGSYGWSGEACKMAEARLQGLNLKLPAPFVRCPFTPRQEALEHCAALGKAVAEAVLSK